MNRQKLLLTILAGILLLALGYAFWATPRQERISGGAPRRPAVSAPAEGAKSSAAEDEMRVRLELLTREDGSSPDFKRNIFHLQQPEPKPLPLPPPPPPLPPSAGATTAPLATEEVQRELARFTFLGFLLKDGVKTIFLSANEEIFVVKKGDRFGNVRRFLVTELNSEKLTIRQDDDPRPIIVPLVEQAPLMEASGHSPGPDVPSRSIPMRRGGTRLPVYPSAEQRPVELPERPELPIPLEPAQPPEPAQPTEPTETMEQSGPAAQAEPEKDPFAVEFNPPQGAPPQ